MADPPIDECFRFAAALDTDLSREQIAALFVAAGWTARKSSWVDYEVRCDWCEMQIVSQSPILISGNVDDVSRADELLAPLRSAGVAFVAEWYDDDELVLELRA